MSNLLGLHAPTRGATDAFIQARQNIGASCILWTLAHGPQDTTLGVTNIVRLPTPRKSNSPGQYLASVHAVISKWFPALRAAWGGIQLAAPAYSVSNMDWYTPQYASHFDVLCAHAYWYSNKDEMHDEAAGAAWKHAAAFGKPVYITEANSNPTTPDQLGQWAAELPESVAGVCFYITDDDGHDPNYNITPEQATEIRAAYESALTAPIQPPIIQPPIEPPPPVVPDVILPMEHEMYSGDSRPMHGNYVFPRQAWVQHIATSNPGEAEAIVATYAACCTQTGYDPNLAIAQGVVETEDFDSPRWHNAHNAAGIGIYSDGTPDVQFGTVERGIQAQIELLNDYYGDGTEPWGILKEFGFGGMHKGFTKLSDMDGVWAADTRYSHAIAAVANDVTGGSAPSVALPTPSVAGLVPLEAIYQIAQAKIGETHTEESTYEFGLCEQFIEENLADAGLPRVRYYSAAIHGDELIAANLLRKGPWKRGEVVVFGYAFDPNGHICMAADYPYVITTYPGQITLFDASQWIQSAGYLGHYIPEGATDQTEEDDMALPVEGKADDGLYEYAWRRSGIALNKESGFYTRWLAEVKKGVPVGIATSPEFSFPDGRTCQTFSSGAVMTAVKQDDGTYTTYIN
ncbi:MAG: glucosaminidase domain-containing protein [Thermomicrobia bacterium]|nr:glucosaminidase domain-containing protein [Thermomicrobia bacterium]